MATGVPHYRQEVVFFSKEKAPKKKPEPKINSKAPIAAPANYIESIDFICESSKPTPARKSKKKRNDEEAMRLYEQQTKPQPKPVAAPKKEAKPEPKASTNLQQFKLPDGSYVVIDSSKMDVEVRGKYD